MSAARAHADTVRDIRQRRKMHSLPMRHIGFVAGEVVLLAILIVLTVAVRTHGGPLPGDVGFQLEFQHWLRPHKIVTEVLDFASTLSWPIPAAISVAAVSVLLLILRRWLDVIVLLSEVGLADGVDYVFSKWIHRARPSGHGIYVAQSIKTSYSFPSGHVMQAVVFYGFLLFLTFQVRNVRACGGLAVLKRGGRERVRLVEVDAGDRAPILRRYLALAPGARPHVPVDRTAPLAEFERIAGQYPVFRVIPSSAS